MKRDRLVYISALVLMFSVCLGVYQFYFKAKLVKYAEDKALLESLNTAYTGLNSTFKDEEPDAVIQQHKAVVESWKDAILVRRPYFDDSEWREYEKPPENVFILQFWYGEQTTKMIKAFWEKAQKKYGALVYQSIPMDLQTMLGVAYAEQWQGYDITPTLVMDQLERLKYGLSLFELLMDSNAKYIRQVTIYDPQTSGFIGATVENWRVGVAFAMEMPDLVKFMDKLRTSDKYFSVEGIKVTHPYIMMKYEPVMQVEMFLLRAHPKADAAQGVGVAPGVAPGLRPPGGGQLGAALLGRPMLNSDDDDEHAARSAVPEPSTLGKFWKWFKHTVLASN